MKTIEDLEAINFQLKSQEERLAIILDIVDALKDIRHLKGYLPEEDLNILRARVKEDIIKKNE